MVHPYSFDTNSTDEKEDITEGLDGKSRLFHA